MYIPTNLTEVKLYKSNSRRPNDFGIWTQSPVCL